MWEEQKRFDNVITLAYNSLLSDKDADMAELADALDLGSSGNTRAGSSPVIRIFDGKA